MDRLSEQFFHTENPNRNLTLKLYSARFAYLSKQKTSVNKERRNGSAVNAKFWIGPIQLTRITNTHSITKDCSNHSIQPCVAKHLHLSHYRTSNDLVLNYTHNYDQKYIDIIHHTPDDWYDTVL